MYHMEKIFVQIAAYRDSDITNTIKSAIVEAANPDRITIGICLQDTESVYQKLKTLPVLIKYVPYKETKGLGWARKQAQKLATDEKYTMQIDGHMRFSKNWDKDGIQMLKNCPSKKAIISHLCPDWRDGNWQDHRSYTLATYVYHEDIVMMCDGTLVKNKLMEQAFICAHYMLTTTDFFKEVPIDPKLGYWYEESGTALRAWTYGWNFYAPNKIIVRHTWTHNNIQREEQPNKHLFSQELSKKRWRRLCGMDSEPLKDYGIGTVRTIEEYEKFSGLNFKNQTMNKLALDGRVNSNLYS
jgi:glycosyltransferase involved in cell wall biosynthesis